jgi:hypothetical protein
MLSQEYLREDRLLVVDWWLMLSQEYLSWEDRLLIVDWWLMLSQEYLREDQLLVVD